MSIVSASLHHLPTPGNVEICAAADPVQIAKTIGLRYITDTTPAICRKCYVHPGVIDAYLDGSLLNFFKQYDEDAKKQFSEGLSPEESRLLAFLEHLSSP